MDDLLADALTNMGDSGWSLNGENAEMRGLPEGLSPTDALTAIIVSALEIQ